MSATDLPRAQNGRAQPPLGTPKPGGDELFVPASHLLVVDRQVSHPAFRLWCVLHRFWFLREPPAMELLQELMGTSVEEKPEPGDKSSRPKVWQPATRRSIERWLKELELAGWLIWARREETARRYHLRTSTRSAVDTAALNALRTLLNSGKATLADVQALLPDNATAGSCEPIPGLHQDAEQVEAPAVHATAESDGATRGSQTPASPAGDATPVSYDLILMSHGAIAVSQDTNQGSHDTIMESYDAMLGSHGELVDGVPLRQNRTPYSEILQNEIQGDPTSSPVVATKTGGDGGVPTGTERYLLRQGFSTRAAHEFRDLSLSAVQTDLERRRSLGQGIGAIVNSWRIEPPQPAELGQDAYSAIARRANQAKAQALAIAPPDASPFEIQYLALDLEEGAQPELALANLLARRAEVLVEGST